MIVVHLVNGPYEGVELSFGELPATVLIGQSPKIERKGSNGTDVFFEYSQRHYVYERQDDFEIIDKVYHAFYEVAYGN